MGLQYFRMFSFDICLEILRNEDDDRGVREPMRLTPGELDRLPKQPRLHHHRRHRPPDVGRLNSILIIRPWKATMTTFTDYGWLDVDDVVTGTCGENKLTAVPREPHLTLQTPNRSSRSLDDTGAELGSANRRCRQNAPSSAGSIVSMNRHDVDIAPFYRSFPQERRRQAPKRGVDVTGDFVGSDRTNGSEMGKENNSVRSIAAFRFRQSPADDDRSSSSSVAPSSSSCGVPVVSTSLTFRSFDSSSAKKLKLDAGIKSSRCIDKLARLPAERGMPGARRSGDGVLCELASPNKSERNLLDDAANSYSALLAKFENLSTASAASLSRGYFKNS